MKKTKTLLVGLLAIVLTVVFLLVGAVLLVNTEMVQRRLMSRAVDVLTEKLQTEVRVDSVAVGLFTHDVRLIGLVVHDQHHREMLSVGHLSAKVNVWQLLLWKRVRISHVRLADVEAHLVKVPGKPANYQFVIDAFTPKKPQSAQQSASKRKPVDVEFRSVRAERISVSYNDVSAQLKWLEYARKGDGRHHLEVEQAGASWMLHSKKGDVAANADLGHLTGWFNGSEGDAELVALNFVTDNHLPRKNTGKPKRGAFDVGHLDVRANMRMRVDSIGKEGFRAEVVNAALADSVAGIHVSELSFVADVGSVGAGIHALSLRMGQTELSIPEASVTFPQKKSGRVLSYEAPKVEGRVVLRDIARPFAPVLAGFKQPLQLAARWQGDAEGMRFSNVRVATPDGRFLVAANGAITDLKDKYQMVVGFQVEKMVARGAVKRTLINQFTVKKFMMKQMDALGDISYHGAFKVLWKQEQFRGHLQTAAGGLDFRFSIDERSKYLQGHVASSRFHLGRVLDMPDLGAIACDADFRFDISKPRTALMRKQKGGKLPIGNLSASVKEVSFKRVTMRDLSVELKSDGAEAQGLVARRRALVDLLCAFSFTNTDELRKIRIKPKVEMHAASEEEKRAKEQRKAQKKAEKEARRLQRKAEKEAKKAAKVNAS